MTVEDSPQTSRNAAGGLRQSPLADATALRPAGAYTMACRPAGTLSSAAHDRRPGINTNDCDCREGEHRRNTHPFADPAARQEALNRGNTSARGRDARRNGNPR